MKLLVGTAILCMLATAPVYAQQNNDNKQQEPSKTPDKHAEKPTSKSPEKAGRPAIEASERSSGNDEVGIAASARSATKDRPSRNQRRNRRRRQNEEKAQQKSQNRRSNSNKRNERQRISGTIRTRITVTRKQQTMRRLETRGEHRIPEDRYRADFGRAHTFHVRHDHDRDHRFQFGGYWFEYTEAWPSDWGGDDDFYIVEIDGVDYLCDARFPDQRIVVIIAS